MVSDFELSGKELESRTLRLPDRIHGYRGRKRWLYVCTRSDCVTMPVCADGYTRVSVYMRVSREGCALVALKSQEIESQFLVRERRIDWSIDIPVGFRWETSLGLRK